MTSSVENIIRPMGEEDIPQLMKIVGEAQQAMKALGIDQWQNGYPKEETLRHDIYQGWGYVLEREGQCAAMMALSFDGEPTYDVIYDGQWLTQRAYGVIHRIAVGHDFLRLGLASHLMNMAEDMAKARGLGVMRIDTHQGNVPMRKLIERQGYTYCGVIYLEDGAQRVAYEKIIQ